MSRLKGVAVVLATAFVAALPFLFRRPPDAGDWRPGDPELVVITPHNEALRHEFARGFAEWHRLRHGRPVRLDWRVIGGTTEIMRYLSSEYARAVSRYVKECSRPGAAVSPAGAMRTDSPGAVSCGIDLFFGGGTYDHGRAEAMGLTVPAWTNGPPPGLFADAAGRTLIPEEKGGERWRGKAYYGTVLSTFGICYNRDRLEDLGIERPPAAWKDLADPRYAGCIGLADPTKSGSVAKAFEMMIHEACAESVAAAGFSRRQIREIEAGIAAGRPEPPAYRRALDRGWIEGVSLVRRIGANARYFTTAAGKIPGDVGAGVTAAGIAIDFFGRTQSEFSARRPDGSSVMGYVTPAGGSGVSADPVSLLRGAPHRQTAVRFIEYALGPEGQKLWNYRVGEPGGPSRFALRRKPIRRDFYPSDDPALRRIAQTHWPHLTDPLWEPAQDAYRLADSFDYVPRWTGRHFGILRDLVRAMCLDSGDELRAAWRTIIEHGGPGRRPEAMRLLEAFPDKPAPLTRETALSVYGKMPRLDRLRIWTAFFRAAYAAAGKAAEQ